MKKRTKKKLWKGFKFSTIFLSKLIFVYPVKGIYYLVKKIKTKTPQSAIKKSKIGSKSQYNKFEVIDSKIGNFEDFENKLITNKSTIGIILGARGTGKSALGLKLLENTVSKNNKKAYAMGFKEEDLPPWINIINTIEEIKPNSFILLDESGIEFSSRQSMAKPNKILSELLLISRHKDLSVIFISQNSSNLEINAIRQTDYLLLKPSSLLQIDFERKKIKEIYEKVKKDFEKLKNNQGLTYVYSETYSGFIENPLPSFWSDKVSKGYR